MSATQGIFATVMAMLAIAGLAIALLALSRMRARAAGPDARIDEPRVESGQAGEGLIDDSQVGWARTETDGEAKA